MSSAFRETKTASRPKQERHWTPRFLKHEAGISDFQKWVPVTALSPKPPSPPHPARRRAPKVIDERSCVSPSTIKPFVGFYSLTWACSNPLITPVHQVDDSLADNQRLSTHPPSPTYEIKCSAKRTYSFQYTSWMLAPPTSTDFPPTKLHKLNPTPGC